MDLEFYLNGMLVDATKDTVFPFNIRLDDLTDPAAIENRHTKTVSIPASANNDKVFGHIWKLDSKIFSFDPLQRAPFALTMGGTLIEEGYAKLNTVKYKGSLPVSYDLTLYGGLGDFFYELSEKTVDQLADPDEGGSADFADNYAHRINSTEIQESWTNDFYKYILSYSGNYDNFESDKYYTDFGQATPFGLTDLIFHNGTYYALFANGILEYKAGDENSVVHVNPPGFIPGANRIRFDDVANRFIAWSNTGNDICYSSGNDLSGRWTVVSVYESSSIIDICTMPGQTLGRYKYVVVTRDGSVLRGDDLEAMTFSRSAENTIDVHGRLDYGVTPDGNYRIFISGVGPIGSSTNSLYVYRPNPIIPSLGIVVTASSQMKGLAVVANQPGYGYCVYAAAGTTLYSANYSTIEAETPMNETTVSVTSEIYGLSNTWPRIPDNTGFTASYVYGYSNRQLVVIGNNNSGIPTAVNVIQQSSTESIFGFVVGGGIDLNGAVKLVLDTDGNTVINYTSDIVNLNNWTAITGYYTDFADGAERDEHQRNEYRSYYQRPCLRFKHIFNEICNQSSYTVDLDPAFFNENNPYWEDTWLMMDRLKFNESRYPDEVTILEHHGNVRSGDQVDFGLMMKENVSQFDFLSRYCQIFGLIFEVDRPNKIIYIRTRNTFFSEYKVVDWTQKVDNSVEWKLMPYAFDFKYLLFNWQESGTHYETMYQSNYSRQYGSSRIDVNYQFSAVEKQVFTNMPFTNIAISEEYDYYFEGRGNKFRDDKILPAAFTKKNNVRENLDLSMCLLFDQGFQTLVQPARITDDVQYMADIGAFSWIEDAGETVTQIPLMTRLTTDGSCSLDFGRPAQSYYDISEEDYPTSATIYNKFWDRYISERYNKETRVIRRKVFLTDVDMSLFRLNTFVIIEDVLWHVNRIIDYMPGYDRTTQVELLRVGDLEAYTEGQDLPVSSPDELYIRVDLSDFPPVIPQEGGNYQMRIESNTSFELSHIQTIPYTPGMQSHGGKIITMKEHQNGGTSIIYETPEATERSQ